MLFNSLHFVAFLCVVLALAALLWRRVVARNVVLLAASYYFYAWWDWRFLGLLILSTCFDWACGLLLADRPVEARADEHPEAPPPPAHTTLGPRSRRDRAILISSMVLNLGLLGFFKYYGFFVDSMAEALVSMGFRPNLPTLSIILPVGISFYTFQSMSYVIDVYRREMPAERSLLDFALFVAFFPQLVAGPIERATALIPQLKRPNVMTMEGLYTGGYLIAWGLFKKVVISDNVAAVTDAVFQADQVAGVGTVLIGAYSFAIQIYCDFSGYSDVARGSARCMGFELMRNFNLPYFAVNPSDFWRRWHVSLSTWLRDYLYIPLGGNRRGPARTYVNLMLTMLLGGLWHGAAWAFVLWGAFHGALLCVHRAARPWLAKVVAPRTAAGAAAWRAVRIVVMFHLVCFGWVLFRCGSVDVDAKALGRPQGMAQVAHVLGGVTFNFRGGEFVPIDRGLLEPHLLHTFLGCAGVMLVVYLAQYLWRDAYVVFRLPAPIRAAVYACFLLAFVVFGEFDGKPFIYFQF